MCHRLIHQYNHTSNRIDYLNCLLSTCRMTPGLSSYKKYRHHFSIILLVCCCFPYSYHVVVPLVLLVLNYSTSYWLLVKVFLLEYCVSLRAYLLMTLFEVSCPTTIGCVDHIDQNLCLDPRHMAFQVLSLYFLDDDCALHDDCLFYACYFL